MKPLAQLDRDQAKAASAIAAASKKSMIARRWAKADKSDPRLVAATDAHARTFDAAVQCEKAFANFTRPCEAAHDSLRDYVIHRGLVDHHGESLTAAESQYNDVATRIFDSVAQAHLEIVRERDEGKTGRMQTDETKTEIEVDDESLEAKDASGEDVDDDAAAAEETLRVDEEELAAARDRASPRKLRSGRIIG